MSKASKSQHWPGKYDPQKLTNTPKFRRERVVVAPVPAMVDPIKTLGHPARPRKRRPR